MQNITFGNIINSTVTNNVISHTTTVNLFDNAELDVDATTDFSNNEVQTGEKGNKIGMPKNTI